MRSGGSPPAGPRGGAFTLEGAGRLDALPTQHRSVAVAPVLPAVVTPGTPGTPVEQLPFEEQLAIAMAASLEEAVPPQTSTPPRPTPPRDMAEHDPWGSDSSSGEDEAGIRYDGIDDRDI